MEGMLLDPAQGKLLYMVLKHVLQVDQLLPLLPLLPVLLLRIWLHPGLASLPMMLLMLVDKLDQQPHKRLLHPTA